MVDDEPPQGDKTDETKMLCDGGSVPDAARARCFKGASACWLRRGGCSDVGVKDHQPSPADDDLNARRASPLFKRSNGIRSGTCHDAACILSKITSPIWRGPEDGQLHGG